MKQTVFFQFLICTARNIPIHISLFPFCFWLKKRIVTLVTLKKNLQQKEKKTLKNFFFVKKTFKKIFNRFGTLLSAILVLPKFTFVVFMVPMRNKKQQNLPRKFRKKMLQISRQKTNGKRTRKRPWQKLTLKKYCF